jgi:hypothetical protein
MPVKSSGKLGMTPTLYGQNSMVWRHQNAI